MLSYGLSAVWWAGVMDVLGLGCTAQQNSAPQGSLPTSVSGAPLVLSQTCLRSLFKSTTFCSHLL